MFEPGTINDQARNNLLSLLQGSPAGYSPETRVAQFFHQFGAQNVDPVTRAKAMQLLMSRGINMPAGGGGTSGSTNTGNMTLSGEVPNYPAPSPQY